MQLVDNESPLGGLNVIRRWTHAFSEDSETVFQAYYDRSRREEIDHIQVLNAYDFDFQHRLSMYRRKPSRKLPELQRFSHTEDVSSGLQIPVFGTKWR